MIVPLLFALPWALFPVGLAATVRLRPRLRGWAPVGEAEAPLVSVIVPARNEEASIGACVASLLRSEYPRFEVVVVDDDSTDRTGEIVAEFARRDPRLRLVRAEPLPAGWFGKPWACAQGAREARGEVLLFTDADVIHEPELLGRSVAAMAATGAGLFSILPRQLLPSFWERLVMPQVLLLILLRYPDAERVNRSPRTRDKIANGQFIMVRRAAYEALGGHGAVRGEVVEDLRLAQHFHARGEHVQLAVADEFMAVRMYRSLGGIVEGWSKNVANGSRHTVPEAIRPLTPWLLALWLGGLWVAPPAAAALGAAGLLGKGWLAWGAAASAVSLPLWAGVNRRLGVPVRYAPLFPVGAAVATGIFVKSALQGERVRWKGRAYGRSDAPAAARDARVPNRSDNPLIDA